jgi:hypothetical protein
LHKGHLSAPSDAHRRSLNVDASNWLACYSIPPGGIVERSVRSTG